jgi:hypothetical protein
VKTSAVATPRARKPLVDANASRKLRASRIRGAAGADGRGIARASDVGRDSWIRFESPSAGRESERNVGLEWNGIRWLFFYARVVRRSACS